jgi:hypothetical protein
MSPFEVSLPDVLAGAVTMAVCLMAWIVAMTGGGGDEA